MGSSKFPFYELASRNWARAEEDEEDGEDEEDEEDEEDGEDGEDDPGLAVVVFSLLHSHWPPGFPKVLIIWRTSLGDFCATAKLTGEGVKK